jgi:eukaryotic-like serine/threonine-protein kinase
VLKKILPQFATDARFRRLFHEEALVIASLQHPNIVAIREFGELKDTLFLALEDVPGADLETLLQLAPIPAGFAALVTAEVCKALEYVHTKTSSTGTPLRIVHRDISPQNILVSRAGEVKLADFGIALSAIRSEKTTQGMIKGKFDYMSPEQATPGTPVDARTDIFALGSVLHRMLFGQAPFSGSTEVETLDRVRRCAVSLEDGSLSARELPLLAVLRRCLQFEVGRRYASAALMGADLDAYLATLAPPPSTEHLGEWVCRSIAEGPDTAKLAKELFGTDHGSRTAIVAEPVPHQPSLAASEIQPRRPRGVSGLRLVLLLAVVAGVTVALTLAVGSRLRSDRATLAAVSAVDARGRITSDAPRTATAAARLATPDAGGTSPDAANRTAAQPRRGRLPVNSIPWANVLLDGRRIGATPIRNLPVVSGRHRIELRDEAGKLLRAFVTRVEPGQTRVLSFDRSLP